MQRNLTLSTAQCWCRTIAFLLLVLAALSTPVATTISVTSLPLAALVSLFDSPFHNKLRQIIQHPVNWLLLLYIVLFCIGVAWSIGFPHEINRRLNKLIPLAATVILIGSSMTLQRKRIIVATFLMVMLVTVLLSYIKFYSYPHFMAYEFDKSSVFKNHIIQSFLFVVAIFLSLHRFMEKTAWRWCYLVFAAILIFNLIFINIGRSGYVIFIPMAIYFCWQHFRWRGLLVCIATLVILTIAAYYGSADFRKRINETTQQAHLYKQGQKYDSIGIRYQSVINAMILFSRKPLIGYGTGSYSAATTTLPKSDTADIGPVTLAYNSYLNVAVELGIIGLILLVLNFLVQWTYSFKQPHELRSVLQVILLAMIFGCLINPWLSDTTELHLYALFLAVGFMKTVAPEQELNSEVHRKLYSA